MVRAWWGLIALAACAVSAAAAPYDDFMRGYTENRAGHSEVAIGAFTAALDSGGLAATYVPTAYYGRAVAYVREGKCAPAAADLDAALKLRPDYLDALILRAQVRACLKDFENARADLDAAVKLRPTMQTYRVRAGFFWHRGKFDLAAADYLKATELAPKNSYYGSRSGYPLVWYAISAARAGTFDVAAFAKQVDDIDIDDWPEPLLDFFMAKAKLKDVYAKAARGDGQVPAQRKCEADFYIGEWRIGHGDQGGKALVQQAEQECPRNFVEYRAAQTDLKRLP